jgi:hypothetical protein
MSFLLDPYRFGGGDGGGGDPSGIQFVGSKTYKFSSGSPTFDFSSLSGGVGQAEPDDFYLAWASECEATAAVPGYSAPAGGIGNLLSQRINNVKDNASRLDYGFVVDPETDSGQWTTSGSKSRMCHLLLFRGVDQTTPLDVTHVNHSASGTGLPNLGAITPVTDGSLIVGLGAGTSANSAIDFDDPIDGSTRRLKDNYSYNASSRIMFMCVSKLWNAGDGAFDPDQFTASENDSYGGTLGTTLALRPVG